MKRAVATLFAALAVLAPLAGCSHRKQDDGTAPAAGRTLPPLTLRDETPDLMLTWIDDKGDTHVELRPQDVPPAGRSMVRVVVSDREDGTRDLFYVADLTKKRDDGTYPAETLRRHDWEAEIEKRRDAYLARTAPPRPASSGPGAPDRPVPGHDLGAATVIIYGASWCGPCHQAADYLKSKGIPYVLKDVEETPGAAAEMREKLARVGRHGGSIPVIDVRGQIIVGFSPAALDRALKTPAGTML
jgi:glutaredoxin